MSTTPMGNNLGPVQTVMVEHVDDILTQWELTIDILNNYVRVPSTVNFEAMFAHIQYKKEMLDRWRRLYPRRLAINALQTRSDMEDVSD